MRVLRVLLLAVLSLGVLLCVTLLCSQPATYLGHTGRVHQVIPSPDGKTLASVSEDRTIRVWDVATRKERTTFRGLAEEVWSLAFSPDGRSLASWGNHDTVQLWDVTTGAERATLRGHTKSVGAVAFSPDGKTLATGSHDDTVKLWDVVNGRERATLKAHRCSGFSLAFSPDGETLASGSSTIKLWNVITSEERAAFEGYGINAVHRLVFSPDGKILASASWWGTSVKLSNVATGEERNLEEPEWLERDSADHVEYIAFSPDGKTLALGHDETLGFWEVASGKNTSAVGWGHRPLDLSINGIRDSLGKNRGNGKKCLHSVWFTPDGGLVALGADGHTVKRWEVSTLGVKPSSVLWGLIAVVVLLATRAFLRSPSRRRARP